MYNFNHISNTFYNHVTKVMRNFKGFDKLSMKFNMAGIMHLSMIGCPYVIMYLFYKDKYWDFRHGLLN